MGTVLDAVAPEHRDVIVEELSHRDPALLADLRDATEPTLEQREGVNRALADAVVWSLGPDYSPNDHGLAVERAVKAFLEAWPIHR
ncbi:hypothetical protein [Mycobacterium simiae]|uniref:hypothetical protein n=1 Tax=Mycobacterium simiae TaxID=1784 RepID=UPI000421C21A|nr:hypothetical protein [Mycobacterium simiae]BBX41035.1 hypothetical protein MSIM_24860 [Mycobacterium simiae]